MVAASLLKESIVGGVAASENPIEFVVEVGIPVLEAHVSQLDASAIGYLLGAIAEIVNDKLAALELATCVLRRARHDACEQVSSTSLSRLAEAPLVADHRRDVESARRRFLTAASSRSGRFSATAASEIESLVAALAETLEGEVAKSVSPAPQLEMYADLAGSLSSAEAKRALDRAESKWISTFLHHSQRRTRIATVACLSQLWQRAPSARAQSAAEDLCRNLSRTLALSPAEHDLAAVVAFTRQIEGLAGAACGALGAIARDNDAQGDAGPAIAALDAALQAADAASATDRQSNGQLATPAIKRVRAKLLDTSLRVLGPSLARRRASRFAKIALADDDQRSVVVVGLAARTLGAGVGLEHSTQKLVALLSCFVVPDLSRPIPAAEEEADEDDRRRDKSRRNKRRKVAVVQNKRQDGLGALGNAENATVCFETLTALVYACSTDMDDARRTQVDGLAADILKLASHKPDHLLVFWRHAKLRVAALRFAKAALAAPSASGDRPNLVALANACCANLFDTDNTVADVVAEIKCLLDTLLRPRAPPFRPARPRAPSDQIDGDLGGDSARVPHSAIEMDTAGLNVEAGARATIENGSAATREDRHVNDPPGTESGPGIPAATPAVFGVAASPPGENGVVPAPAPVMTSVPSSAVRADDPMEDEQEEEPTTTLADAPSAPPESPAASVQDEDDVFPDIVTTTSALSPAPATAPPAIVSQPPEEASPTLTVEEEDDDFPEIVSS